jgi:hypothetical protein
MGADLTGTPTLCQIFAKMKRRFGDQSEGSRYHWVVEPATPLSGSSQARLPAVRLEPPLRSLDRNQHQQLNKRETRTNDA